MEDKPLTGIRKREQIKNVNKQVLIWTAVAAAAVTVCALVAVNFMQRISYQNKVIDAKEETNSTLESNINTNIPALVSNVNVLETDTNLIRLSRDLTRYSVFQVVIDSLPMFGDQVALAASLQREILPRSGVNIEQISVINSGGSSNVIMEGDGGSTSTDSEMPTPQSMTFSISVSGNYEAIKTMLLDIERTIRPIDINTISMQGTNDDLQVTINATTYYVPKVNYTLGSKEIEP